MAGTAYHMETLRKTRVIERKQEAMRQLQENAMGQTSQTGDRSYEQKQAPLVYSEPGHYAASRCGKVETPVVLSKDDVVFEEVVHDPNFKYRMLKEAGCAPLHVDPIYSIMYPGPGQRRK